MTTTNPCFACVSAGSDAVQEATLLVPCNAFHGEDVLALRPACDECAKSIRADMTSSAAKFIRPIGSLPAALALLVGQVAGGEGDDNPDFAIFALTAELSKAIKMNAASVLAQGAYKIDTFNSAAKWGYGDGADWSIDDCSSMQDGLLHVSRTQFWFSAYAPNAVTRTRTHKFDIHFLDTFELPDAQHLAP